MEAYCDSDPLLRVRKRTTERFTRDILAKIKPDDRELPEVNHNPYTIGNVLWLSAALIVFRLAEVGEAILYDPRVDRFYFNIGCLLILINVAICLFCVVWLSWIKQISSNQWEQLYPAAIPTATASFVIGAIFVTKGMWPVWGYLTPPILLVLFMGVIVLVVMIPACGTPASDKSRDSVPESRDHTE